MKIKRVLGLIVLAVVVAMLGAIPVFADPAATVTIIGIPSFTSGGILSFNVVYITDNQMDLTWTVGPDVSNVMVRGEYGNYPSDISDEHTTPSDGYLVYYGPNLSATDNSVNMNFNNPDTISNNSNTPFTIYYKAWAQRTDGTWYVKTGTGNKESRELLLLVYTLVVVIIMGIAFWKHDLVFWMLDTVLWLVWTYWMYNTPIGIANTYINTALALVGAGAVLACIYEDFTCIANLLKTRKRPPTYDEEQAKQQQEIYNLTRRRFRY